MDRWGLVRSPNLGTIFESCHPSHEREVRGYPGIDGVHRETPEVGKPETVKIFSISSPDLSLTSFRDSGWWRRGAILLFCFLFVSLYGLKFNAVTLNRTIGCQPHEVRALTEALVWAMTCRQIIRACSPVSRSTLFI